jgi:hypothetical protein
VLHSYVTARSYRSAADNESYAFRQRPGTGKHPAKTSSAQLARHPPASIDDSCPRPGFRRLAVRTRDLISYVKTACQLRASVGGRLGFQ